MFHVYRTSQGVPFSLHLNGAKKLFLSSSIHIFQEQYEHNGISTRVQRPQCWNRCSIVYFRHTKNVTPFLDNVCGLFYRFKITRDILYIRFLQSQYFLTEYFPGFREKKGVEAFD